MNHSAPLSPTSQVSKNALIAKKLQLQRELPHLYGQKFYGWGRAFFESRNRFCMLTAANQVGKSSIQIRKMLHWATATNLWLELWPLAPVPREFWYLYPSYDLATSEFQNKIVPFFMPKRGGGIFKRGQEECFDPIYGWKAIYVKKKIHSIEFKNGLVWYFKAYTQNVHNLQAGSVHYIACFTAGHLIVTSKGLKKIENVVIGDLVLTRLGFKPVKNVGKNKKEVIQRHSDFRATPDHRFLTEDGFVEYGTLPEKARLLGVPFWKLIEKLYYLKESYLQGGRSLQTIGAIATSLLLLMIRIFSCMFVFGNLTIRKSFLKDMSFITRTLTPWTIGCAIWSVLRGRSIPEYINLSNGKHNQVDNLNVNCVKKILNHVQHNLQQIGTVVKSVGKRLIGKKLLQKIVRFVGIVTPLNSNTETQASHVLSPVHQSSCTKEDVYELSVEGLPEFCCNGVIVHNCDEELPEDLYSELSFRLKAVEGYFSMVFTATRNQMLWHLAMEAKGDIEKFPHAFKIQISMYDCQYFEDGTPGMYNEVKIAEAIADCKSDIEVDRRVRGRFVSEEGRKYPAFDPTRHFIKPFDIPPDWLYYGGVDPGTGGIGGHPAGMGIIAVRPDYRYGVVCAGLRLDGVDTTSSDILEAFVTMRGSIRCNQQVYDHAAKDFYTVASRSGEFFIKAEKSHATGEDVVNTLFKTNALHVFDTPELRKLGVELITLKKETNKKDAKDDLIDGACRYPAMAVPWDFTYLKGTTSEYSKKVDEIRRRKVLTPEEVMADQIRMRRGDPDPRVPLGWEDWADELSEYGVTYE